MSRGDKQYRADASQFFIAGELCRRKYVAVITMGNCPNTDILCSNAEGTKFVHVQVKTYVPGGKTCSVGQKAERDYGASFVWVLGGIPEEGSDLPFEYYIIPASVMARNIKECHQIWSDSPGKKGQKHDELTKLRMVHLPPGKHLNGWDISKYKNNWSIIAKMLGT